MSLEFSAYDSLESYELSSKLIENYLANCLAFDEPIDNNFINDQSSDDSGTV